MTVQVRHLIDNYPCKHLIKIKEIGSLKFLKKGNMKSFYDVLLKYPEIEKCIATDNLRISVRENDGVDDLEIIIDLDSFCIVLRFIDKDFCMLLITRDLSEFNIEFLDMDKSMDTLDKILKSFCEYTKVLKDTVEVGK